LVYNLKYQATSLKKWSLELLSGTYYIIAALFACNNVISVLSSTTLLTKAVHTSQRIK